MASQTGSWREGKRRRWEEKAAEDQKWGNGSRSGRSWGKRMFQKEGAAHRAERKTGYKREGVRRVERGRQ